jgi:GNAT superfamily N-acetyltransferase
MHARTDTTTTEPEIRRATPDDAEACHEVMWASVTDFGERHGTPLRGTVVEWWASGEPLHRFLADHAAEWWVAEEPGAGTLVGYARSIERGGLFELTEFFVVPTSQSRGVGRALIERAFPLGRGDVRSIIATTDARALTRYYAADTAARFPMLTLVGAPSDGAAVASDVTPHRIDLGSEADRRELRDLDRSVLEYPRAEAEIRWLLEDREGYVYVRGRRAVGFAFVGKAGSGPVAALDPADLPDILLHVEARAHALGLETIDLQVPGPNETAARHLLRRGFRVDPWVNLLLSNRPFGRFDRFIPFGPPVFL